MERIEESLKGLCIKLFDIGALKFGNFKMKVGVDSPVYFDLRLIVSHPDLMDQLSTLVWQFIELRDIKPNVICGVPYTALPIATLLSVKSNIPMLIRRKEPKNYGTKKLIEGQFSPGDECLIVEDVVTTGCSILETFHDLKRDNLVVKDTIVVIDREQGGFKNLTGNGINMHCLWTLSKALDTLHEAGRLDSATVDKVNQYISENQMTPDGRPMSKVPTESRLTMSFGNRAKQAKCDLTRRLFELMEKKQSNLIAALDVTTSEELLSLAESVGEHAVVIKTHYDIVDNWSESTEKQLKALAERHQFLIMEDRKFADIGNTVLLQCSRVFSWADVVTLHSLTGECSIMAAKKAAEKYSGDKGIFLVAELSSKNNLISTQYMKTTSDLADSHVDIVMGLVCQHHNLLSFPGMIQVTPGVSTTQGEDSLGQQYVSPEEAVLGRGADLVVVGRAVTQSPDPPAAALSIKEKLWDAYQQRIKH